MRPWIVLTYSDDTWTGAAERPMSEPVAVTLTDVRTAQAYIRLAEHRGYPVPEAITAIAQAKPRS